MLKNKKTGRAISPISNLLKNIERRKISKNNYMHVEVWISKQLWLCRTEVTSNDVLERIILTINDSAIRFKQRFHKWGRGQS